VTLLGDELLSKIFRKAARTKDVEIGVFVEAYGNSDQQRQWDKIIYNVYPPFNRNPFYFKTRDSKRFRDRMGAGLRRELKGSFGAFDRAINSAALFALDTFKKQLIANDFAGSFTPLSDKYRKFKEKRRPGKPMLMFDDDLYNGLSVKSRRK
jgi:hypothetical protein